MSIEAELAFYPGNAPLRALVKTREMIPTGIKTLSGHPNIASFLDSYVQALARNPWIESFPVLLNAVIPIRNGETWAVCDSAGKLLPLPRSFTTPWTLCAVSGGHPITVFGEWDGRFLFPLHTWKRKPSKAPGG